jgi:hypothetical protein
VAVVRNAREGESVNPSSDDRCVEVLLATARSQKRPDGSWSEATLQSHRELGVDVVPYVLSVDAEVEWGKASSIVARGIIPRRSTFNGCVALLANRLFTNVAAPCVLVLEGLSPPARQPSGKPIGPTDGFRFSPVQEERAPIEMSVLRHGDPVAIKGSWSALVPPQFVRGAKFLLSFDLQGLGIFHTGSG